MFNFAWTALEVQWLFKLIRIFVFIASWSNVNNGQLWYEINDTMMNNGVNIRNAY